MYQRLIDNVEHFQELYKRNDRLGWLNACPSNVGTAIFGIAKLKIPKLLADPDKFEDIRQKHNNIQIMLPEHMEWVEVQTSSKKMGISEFDMIKSLYDGIVHLLAMEKEQTT